MKQPSPSESTPDAPLMVGPSHRSSTVGKQAKKPGAVQYGLVAVVAGVVGVMAVPDMAPEYSNLEGLSQLTQLQYKLESYRGSLEQYRAQHHVYPGYKPGRAGAWDHGQPSGVAFKRQMVLWTDEWGNPGQLSPGRRELGPYLETGLIKNPINGLESVRILRDAEPFPTEPSGTTGWYFKPATGELRPNCEGVSVATGEPYYTL